MCYSLFSLFVFSTSNAQEVISHSLSISSDLISEDKIEEQVISSAQDSIDYDIEHNKVFLYNNAEIDS